MKKNLLILALLIFGFGGIAYAAPYYVFEPTLLPTTNNGFDLGTTTRVWRNAYVTQLCLSADCKTAWPSGSPGGSSGQVQYNGSGSFAGVATTTLTAGTNVTFTGTPGYLIGGTNLTINATGGSGTFSWTPSPGYNATTTVLAFPGFISSASSTISYLGSGGVASNNGRLYNAATTTFNSPLNYASGAVTLSTAGTWSGLAGTASALSPGANINNVAFTGAGNITIFAASSTLLGDVNTFTNAPKLGSLSGFIGGNSGNLYGFATSTIFGVGTPGYVWSYQNGAAGWYATSTSGGGSVTAVTATSPIFSSGGTSPNITWAGLATTTQPASSNLLVSNGGAGVFGVATTSVTCSGNTTCTQFSVIGPSPITISSTGGGTGLSTTSPIAGSNLLVYSAAGAGAAYGAATTTPSFGLGFTSGGTWSVLGSAPTLSIATSSLYSGTTGQFPYFSGTNTLTATSSLFITSSGNIGIGTTSPYGLLSVDAPAGTKPYFVIGSTTSEVFSIKPSTGASGTFTLSTTTAGCAQFGSAGLLFSTGVSCGTGSGGSTFGQSWEIVGGFLSPTTTVPIAVTSTGTSTFAGPVAIKGYVMATSTVICIYPEHCQYQTNPNNATNTAATINAAMTYVSGMGGGTITMKDGTYMIADTLQIPSNITLQGTGSTTIKAVDNYSPTVCVAYERGSCFITHTLLTGKMVTATSSPISNITIRNITFDANGLNKANLTSDGTQQAIHIISGTNVHFENNTVINSVNWSVFFGTVTNFWIEGNRVFSGQNTAYDQADGIHVRHAKNGVISNNVISTNEGGNDGDDAIAVVSDEFGGTATTTTNVIVSNNVIKSSGSRGILVAVAGPDDVTDVKVTNNTISNTLGNGILIQKIGTGAGIFKNIDVSDNTVVNFGDATHSANGIRADYTSTTKYAFDQMSVNGNTIRLSGNSSSSGINLRLKGNGLSVNNNNISQIISSPGIRIGDASAPVKDLTVVGNRIDIASSTNNGEGLILYGTARGVITGNTIKGNLTGTTYGIILYANATAGNDAVGIANAEPSEYNLVADNNIYNFDNGIAELNNGANPDNNSFRNNVYNTTTAPLTMLGSLTGIFEMIGGFFGMGTTTPGTSLSIGNTGANTINLSTTATSTFGSGLNIRTGCFAVNGVCVTGGGSTNAGGSDTQVQFNDGGTAFGGAVGFVWKKLTGFLGIGTTTPSIGVTTIASSTAPQLSLSAGASFAQWVMRNAGGNLYIATTTVDGTATTTTAALTIKNLTGYVGIGVNSPIYKLDIAGNGNVYTHILTTSGQIKDSGTFFDNGTDFAGEGLLGETCLGAGNWSVYNGADCRLAVTTTGNVGIGTSSPIWPLNIFASANPQLSLSAGAGLAQWTLRNAGGNLYFATTTVAGTATTTISALTLSGSGKPGLSIGSSTPAATLAVMTIPANFTNQFMVGSSTATSFTIDNNGAIFAPKTLGSGATQTGYWCYDTNGQLIRDTAVCIVSARKFKKDILPLDVGLSDLLQLTPVSYYNKDSTFGDGRLMGFIADDTPKSLEEMLVTKDSNGDVHGFRYDQLTSLIVKSIKQIYQNVLDLVAWNKDQDESLKKLEAENDELRHRIEVLESKL